jgi:acetylornithine deacetylase/succinyl-diaminopimelate desuccinylase-like protein
MHLVFDDPPMTAASLPQDLDRYLAEHDRRIHDELYEFLRIPSVSARSEHKGDLQRAAEFLRADLARIGLKASVHQTAGHPVVLGEWRGAGAGAPTILVYGHYDVQPPEPIEEWVTPPFEPTLRDGNIYCRGSVDDKGQLFLHVKALEAHLKTRGRLPINVIVLAEGEEEVGSENLDRFIAEHRELLKCDGSSATASSSPTRPCSRRGCRPSSARCAGWRTSS